MKGKKEDYLKGKAILFITKNTRKKATLFSDPPFPISTINSFSVFTWVLKKNRTMIKL